MSAHSEAAKLYFKTGLKPSEAQFAQFIEWLRFKDQPISFDDLTAELQAFFTYFGRTVQLPAGVFTYNAPAGTLLEALFFGEQPNTLHVGSVIEYTIRVGITPGGDEILEDRVVDINDPQTGVHSLRYYCLPATTIYFTATPTVGEPNASLIKIYKS